MEVDLEIEAECDKRGENLIVHEVGSKYTTLQIKVEPCSACCNTEKESEQPERSEQ